MDPSKPTRALPSTRPLELSIRTSKGRPRRDGGKRGGVAHVVVTWWPRDEPWIATRCSIQHYTLHPSWEAMRGTRVLAWPEAPEVTCKNCLRCGPVTSAADLLEPRCG